MFKRILFGTLMMFMATSSFASIINVAVTPAGDGVYNNYRSPYGKDASFAVDASPNGASYYFYQSSGTTTDTNTAYAQFNLSGLSSWEDITSISLNLNILSAAVDSYSKTPGKINHSSSDGNGNASQKLGGNEFVASIIPDSLGWKAFDVTAFVKQDMIDGQNWSAFSFDYDGSYYTWDSYRTSGFSFSSAEQNNGAQAAFLSFTTSAPTGDPVPEPGTMLLMGVGLAGLIGARSKNKKP